MARMVTYECTQCGTKVVVTEAAGSSLQPIYCCGMGLAQVASVRGSLGAAKMPKGPLKSAAKAKKGKTGKSLRKTAEGKTVSKAKHKVKAKTPAEKNPSKKKK